MHRGIATALFCITALLLTACGGNGSTTNAGPGNVGVASPFALTSPGQLRSGSAVAGYACTGADYETAWPTANYTVDGTVGVFSPDWPGGGSTGLAYACWQFELPIGEERTGEIALDWVAHGDWGDLWIACADHAADCWDWQAGADTPATYTDDHVSSGNRLYLAVCTTGNAEWRLNGAEVGTLPDVTAVTPLGLIPGTPATIVPEFTGNVDTWSWDFGDAGTCADPALEQPELTASATAAEYACSVTAANQFGSDTFEFTLYNGVVKVLGISPTGINDTSPFYRIKADYVGVADTWSWDFGTAGTLSSGDSEEAILTPAYNIGFHACSVTATNSYGSDTCEFDFPVFHEAAYSVGDGTTCGGLDLVIDSQDRPHISYLTQNPEQICYAYFDAGSWHVETVDTECGKSNGTSIVLDAADQPHIAYGVAGIGVSSRYAWKDGEDWQSVPLPNADPQPPSIAIDSTGTVCAAWFGDVGSGNHTLYGEWDGSSWTTEVVYSSVSEANSFPVLEFAPDDTPYISIIDINVGIQVCYKPGDTWQYLPAVWTLYQLDPRSMQIDTDNHVHLLYEDYILYYPTYHITGHWVIYAQWDGTDWSYIDLTDRGMNQVSIVMGNSLMLDDTGTPHYCLQFSHDPDGTNNEVHYGWIDNWSFTCFRAADEEFGCYSTCMDLDSTGQVYICHADVNHGMLYLDTLAP